MNGYYEAFPPSAEKQPGSDDVVGESSQHAAATVSLDEEGDAQLGTKRGRDEVKKVLLF